MKTHSKWLSFGLTAGLLVAAALVTERGAWSIDPQHRIGDIDKMIEGANTKSDHEALAAHYEAEAKALEAKSADHERMREAYERAGRYPAWKGGLVQHCNILILKYREAAQENRELAKMHHQLAVGMK
jgi:hypothetical protein